jgi:glycosyltransferase involved in cell wall biosynthesis
VIRVGFHPIGGNGWMGGRSYLWNLLHALSLVEQRRLQPVLITSDGTGRELLLTGVEHFSCGGPMNSSWAHVAGNAAALLGCNWVAQHWLRRAAVDVFSHGVAPLGARARVPWIYMIHDVQHRRCPEFFTVRRRVEREWLFRTALDHAAAVIVSSKAVRKDLLEAYGSRAERVRVLPDVSSPRVAPSELATLEELGRNLGVPRKYFHLPNQFWKHKNHALVVEALADAHRRERDIVVVATGAKDDPRFPRYYDELMSRVSKLGLRDRFRHLGLVSHDEVMALMRHSVAVINPSWFEGRSLTVGEAKSLGKRILLSDIEAHREQDPPHGRFFAPDDPGALAELLIETWRSFDAVAEKSAMTEAAQRLPARMRAFGVAYEDLVVGVVGERGLVMPKN